MKPVEHRILYRDPFAYCAHPHGVRLREDSWMVVFNRAPRRPFLLHPPHDPHYYNVLMRSSDQGENWTEPQVVPNYDWYGVECAGLTPLADGRLMLNQWRFRWLPVDQARCHPQAENFLFPEHWVLHLLTDPELSGACSYPPDLLDKITWARANGGAFVHFSADEGRTWSQTVALETTPYSGGYGMRGGVQLPNGEILLPLSDVPQYRKVFLLRSRDGGQSWEQPVAVAQAEGLCFEEPTLLYLPDGQLLMLLRENTTHVLHQTFSEDGGFSWTAPVATSIWGYPAHLLLLPDGRILCVYGYRRPPFGIRAVISPDLGKTWNVEETLVIREDLPNGDLGYPSSILCSDGTIFTVYYGQDCEGVTCIMASCYSLN
ncbi:MAG: sialidase family protein [Anaerolineales bacterium]|nr:glycoside hydrolase [Anaerolineales bacterium]MDW8447423.1 sialidase family protein [Anaerolineales bacterium]